MSTPALIARCTSVALTAPGRTATFFNQGQCCVDGSRLYVQQAVFDEVVEGVSRIASNIRVCGGFDPETEIGPLISDEQYTKVLGSFGLDDYTQLKTAIAEL